MSVSAHHSISAEFDEKNIVTITGKVTKMEWVNPHAHFYVEGEVSSTTSSTTSMRIPDGTKLRR